MRFFLFILFLASLSACARRHIAADNTPFADPYLIVLGIAQDGGVPQAGHFDEPGWTDASARRRVVCLGIVDPPSGKRWMIEATPDFPAQLRDLALSPPARPLATPVLDGIFLTHAHIGHYTGLMYLGHEAIGAAPPGVLVYAMPRMREFLATSGPWSQLVKYKNIDLLSLEVGHSIELAAGAPNADPPPNSRNSIRITPFLVPHRQEFSEVVGFRIDGPHTSVLFIPDIDSWQEWDLQGVHLEDQLATVDAAYLDGTFFANGEIPGRDMTGFPHPFITTTMARLSDLPASERAKVRFIHLNHTNPALWTSSPASHQIEAAGFSIASQGERVGL